MANILFVREKYITIVAITVFLCLFLNGKSIYAKTYLVGDAAGWSFNISNWPDGKSFKTRDVLVFKYNPSFHDVVIVDKAHYDACSFPDGAPRFNTGNDKITLQHGPAYFICGVPKHCTSGMHIAVTAT